MVRDEADRDAIKETLNSITELVTIGQKKLTVVLSKEPKLEVVLHTLDEQESVLRDTYVDISTHMTIITSEVLATLCFSVLRINGIPVEELFNINLEDESGEAYSKERITLLRAEAVRTRFLGTLNKNFITKLWEDGQARIEAEAKAGVHALIEGNFEDFSSGEPGKEEGKPPPAEAPSPSTGTNGDISSDTPPNSSPPEHLGNSQQSNEPSSTTALNMSKKNE